MNRADANDDDKRLVREALAMTTALYDQVLAALEDGSIQTALVPLQKILSRLRQTIFEPDEVLREIGLLALTGLVAAFGLSAAVPPSPPDGPSEN